jgi:hypothetical protein
MKSILKIKLFVAKSLLYCQVSLPIVIILLFFSELS